MSAKSAFASGFKEKEATPFASDSKEAILTSLGIPTHLCDHSDHGLQISYKKYKAHLEACNTYNQMVSEGSWLGNKLTAVDLVELFVSKSFWHSHVTQPNLGVPSSVFDEVCISAEYVRVTSSSDHYFSSGTPSMSSSIPLGDSTLICLFHRLTRACVVPET